MENEDLIQPWRREEHNRIRDMYFDKVQRRVETTLENRMIHLLSDYSIKIDNFQRMVISLTKELDNLRKENVFLLDQINELIDNADDVGCSGIYVDKK